MIVGERFLFVGSHAQGLKSIRRGRGVSAATVTNVSATRRTICRGSMAQVARATATAMRAGLRLRFAVAYYDPPLTHLSRPQPSQHTY